MNGSTLMEAAPLILGTGGITAFVVAVVQSLFNRRKLKAETTSLLTSAAGDIITNLQGDNALLREQQRIMVILEARRATSEKARDDGVRHTLDAHYRYDLELAGKLRDFGIEVPDPPRIEFPNYDYDRTVPPLSTGK